MRFYFLLFIVFIGVFSSAVQAADKNTEALNEQQQRELAQLEAPLYCVKT